MANEERFTLRGFDQDNDPVFYDQHTGRSYVATPVLHSASSCGMTVYECDYVEGRNGWHAIDLDNAPRSIADLVAPIARTLNLFR